MRRKSKYWSTIGDTINKATKRIGIGKRMRQYELWNQWDTIAGPLVAAHAKPCRWQGNVLVLAVEHASWMQELSYLRSELLEKIRNHIPHIVINDLRFEIGKITNAPKISEEKSDLPALDEHEREFIEQAAKEIRDDQTRLAVHELITKDFQRKKLSRK